MHYDSIRVSDLDRELSMLAFLLVAVPSGHLDLPQASILLGAQRIQYLQQALSIR